MVLVVKAERRCVMSRPLVKASIGLGRRDSLREMSVKARCLRGKKPCPGTRRVEWPVKA